MQFKDTMNLACYENVLMNLLCINCRWLFDTIRQGYKDGYDEDDIPEAMPDHKSELLTSGLQK